MSQNNFLLTITLYITLSLFNVCFAQQDSQFTQYMYNTGTINPAYTGTRGIMEITSLYRAQWVGLDGAPRTFNLTGGTPVGERIGLGISFIQDNIKPSEESTISADFSYTIPVNDRLKLSFGIKAGINLLNIDYGLLNLDPGSSDNVFQFNVDNRLTPIIGAGVFLYSEKWYMGLSVPNMLETTHYDVSTISNATEKAHFYITSGYVFDLSDNVKFKPAVLGKFTSGAPAAIDITANFLFNEKFTLGVAYRFDAAMSALAGFQITDKILIGYAFDYSTTKIANYSSGSHEIFLRFELNKFMNRCKCVSPRFF